VNRGEVTKGTLMDVYEMLVATRLRAELTQRRTA
jgi:hypothetical protein